MKLYCDPMTGPWKDIVFLPVNRRILDQTGPRVQHLERRHCAVQVNRPVMTRPMTHTLQTDNRPLWVRCACPLYSAADRGRSRVRDRFALRTMRKWRFAHPQPA